VALLFTPLIHDLNVSGERIQVKETTSDVLIKTSNSWDGTPYEAYTQGNPELTVVRIEIPRCQRAQFPESYGRR
jgi:hypothetical protein